MTDNDIAYMPGPHRDNGAAQDCSDQAVAQALTRLLRTLPRLKAQISARAQDQGVNVSGLLVLRPLIESGPQRSSAIAEALDLDPSWISRQVHHLVEGGLVERRVDPRDGRAIILAPTPAGEAAFVHLQRITGDLLASKVAYWTQPDRERLATLLNRFASELETGSPTAATGVTHFSHAARRSHE